MSGGSNDDAVLAISHFDVDRKIKALDVIESQAGRPPFNPRSAVKKFAALMREYRVSRVIGDAYAGQTFQRDFEEFGIAYEVSKESASELYEAFEPMLNAGEVELLDDPKLVEQLLTLVWRGSKIDHQPGDHDDFANAAAGAIVALMSGQAPLVISDEIMKRIHRNREMRGRFGAAGVDRNEYRRNHQWGGRGRVFFN